VTVIRAVASVVENIVLGPRTFVLRLDGCEFLAGTLPGQFVMLRAEDWGTDPLLPRAFSLLAVRPGGQVDILVKASGKASGLLEHALPGARMAVLGPLGVAFPEPSPERRDWLVAGGVGLAPLMMQALRAREIGLARQLTLFYGGRSARDLVLTDELAGTGVELVLVTEDGSRGLRGLVTAAVEQAPARHGAAPTIMACGPDPMLHAVAALCHRRGLPAHLSLEGEMACGIGACLACAVPCRSRPFSYTCVQGPVFPLAELAGPFAAAAEEGSR
jgi:dihydroorotate dehydrogenase electron transfer subunit